MKIKQKKQVNLPKLIEWAWGNGVKDIGYCNEDLAGAEFDECGNFRMGLKPFVKPTDTFEIEEEVEIDEDTRLNFIAVNKNNIIYTHSNISINDRLNLDTHEWYGTKFIYLQNEDGSIGDLIWENGKMVE